MNAAPSKYDHRPTKTRAATPPGAVSPSAEGSGRRPADRAAAANGRWQPYAHATAGGLLLAAADHPLGAWPLAAVALLPLFYAFVRLRPSLLTTAGMALVFGAIHATPTLVALEFPALFAIPLGLIASLFWVLILCAIRASTGLSPFRAALAAGATAALVEWANVTWVPIWGTAQSFVRGWSSASWAMQIVSLTGIAGIVFVLVAGQMLLAQWLVEPRRRGLHALALAAGAAIFVLFGFVRARLEPAQTLRVATYGWSETDSDAFAWTRELPERQVDQRYAPAVAEASREGARLLVFPEVGLFVDATNRDPVMARLAALARQFRIVLAVGYFDASTQRNESRFFLADGGDLPAYVKTHLIPFAESYNAGDGSLVEARVDGVRVGTMICQDDNFTDLARRYGSLGTGLVAVPTNDWSAVARVHFENSLLRPVENGYGLIRATHNGVSAIVSPNGHVLGQRDHFRDGPGLVVATVPVGDGPTLYARWGGAVPWAALSILAAAVGARRLRLGVSRDPRRTSSTPRTQTDSLPGSEGRPEEAPPVPRAGLGSP